MQKITSAILAISIAAVIVGYLASSNMLPTTFMIAQSTPTPNISDSGGILGHVTYVVRGSDGNIKSYAQTDNQRTVEGINCALQILFNSNNGQALSTNGTATDCTGGGSGTGMILSTSTRYNGFNVIGLINGSSTITGGASGQGNGTDEPTAAATYGNKCGCGGSTGPRASANDGFINNAGIAANEGAPLVASTITGGAAYNSVTITSPSFSFSNTNGMTIRGSMLTNSTSASAAQAFAENKLSPTVTVGSGDTLTVTWTITLT